MSSTTPLVDALCLLGSYSEKHSKGNDHLKAARFNLTKARRQAGTLVGKTSGYNASDLREEFQAQAVLQCRSKNEPSLVDEEDTNERKKNEGVNEDEDMFKLYLDGIPKQENEESSSRSPLETSNEATGLRQRKNAPSTNKDEKEGENKWTAETVSNEKEDEREKQRANPINLFGGLSPPPLKVSQANAKEALKSYVEAANLVSEIMGILNQLEEQKK